jgi:glycosyltransferase involved in cell wall biosynthesis
VPRTTVRVLSTAHDVADARLGRIVRALLATDACDVTLEARGDASSARALAVLGARVEVPPGGGAGERVRRALLRPFSVTDDVLVIVDPELVLTAWMATRLRRRVLVVDVHEDYAAVAHDRPWARGVVGLLARVAVRFVLRLTAHASLTTVADTHVPPHHARNRLVVQNLPARGALPDAGTPDGAPRAVYVGDLRPSRGLWAMIDAVAGTDDWSLDLVGSLSEVTRTEVDTHIEAAGVTGRVRLHGRLPSDEAWQVAHGAWCGLNLLEATPAYVAAMPTKLYEYLDVGLPVLATPLPRVRRLLDEAGAGACATREMSPSTILRLWSTAPHELAPLRAGARRWADEHLAAASPFDGMASAILSLSHKADTP